MTDTFQIFDTVKLLIFVVFNFRWFRGY